MKNLLVILLVLLGMACGNKDKNPPDNDESRGYYPEENVDASTVDAVSKDSQDSVKSSTDTVSSRQQRKQE